MGGAYQLALAGSLIALAIIAIHIWRAPIPKAEIVLILASFGIGIVFESILTLSGISQYADGILIHGFAPYWMVLMWGLFATTLNVSMRWVKNLSLPVLAVLGAVLAPLSYLAGSRLGAVLFSDTTLALIVIAIGWAILFPLIVAIARRYNGYPMTQHTSTKHAGDYVNV